MTTSISKVLMSSCNEAEGKFLRRWCEIAASNGGSFSIETIYLTNWFVKYTITWPEGLKLPQGIEPSE